MTKDLTKEAFVDLLNEDLKLEFLSLVQYVQHIASIKGARYQETLNELSKHLDQELQHAKILAKQIYFLGGVPTTAVPEAATVDGGAEALQQDLDLETDQLERYRKRVEQANELGVPDVAEALSPLISQTQDHVHDLRSALGK